jgi:hypothetical protein
MPAFLTLHAGETTNTSRVVAVTADEDIVVRFAAELLGRPPEEDHDPVLEALEGGRRRALKAVASGNGNGKPHR